MTTEQYQEITKKMWDIAKIGPLAPRDSMDRKSRFWDDLTAMTWLWTRLMANWESADDATYDWYVNTTTFNTTQTIHTVELRQSYYNVRYIYQVRHGNLATAMWLAVAAKMDLLTGEIAKEFDIYYHKEEKTDSGCWLRVGYGYIGTLG